MAVVNLNVERTSLFAGGESFGEGGQYQLIEGTVYFAVDPSDSVNDRVTDIHLGVNGKNGMVSFSSDFAILMPLESAKSCRRIVFDVVNRGRKTVMGNFNSAEGSTDPGGPIDPGNGFLLRNGYTIVWCGWQYDVPSHQGLMGLRAPEAFEQNQRLVGNILCQFQSNEPTNHFLLADRVHTPHPPVNMEDPNAKLTVRNHPNSPAEEIDRSEFSFVRIDDDWYESGATHVYKKSGFEPGLIYQLVYETVGSPIVGLGFLAVRDIVSFLKHGLEQDGNPCAGGLDYAFAFGSSQSGRFLREMIYLGFNEDESGLIALDGIIAHVAGGMRGEFNLRFGQPSKDVCFIIPELFPFTELQQVDPQTGKTDALLSSLEKRHMTPKIMFTNTSAEYWRGDAALIHTDLEKQTDAPEHESVRRYLFSGTQHGSGFFPPIDFREGDGVKGQIPFNMVDYAPLHRAALVNLDKWVSGESNPPPSCHPSLDCGTAMESKSILERFKLLPGINVPVKTTMAMRLDYGPFTHLGRTVQLPAIEGETYPALVSDIDDNFNEIAGIRLPDIEVPLATSTGWNLRHDSIGNPELYIGITGGLAGWTKPFASTKVLRQSIGDPRLSIEERYQSREHYVSLVENSAILLVDKRYMLEEDVKRMSESAGLKFDFFTN
ncbi:MAG: alpha/beta hydrolase domain-containing protein [Chloroflexota bacterium]|nr:alpha/beta hydrolase domain-containing protein [Chloroflexota bacterium]